MRKLLKDKIRSIILQEDKSFLHISSTLLRFLNSHEVESEKIFSFALDEIISELKREYGIGRVLNFLHHYEIDFGIRKPTLAIYDHAFHFIGGAQKYGLTLAKALEERFDLTIISNREVTFREFSNWYGLNFKNATIKIIPIPYFDKRGTSHIDPHRIVKGSPNPFHIISRESGNYDVFINNGMLEMVFPLSLLSIMICHFPERRPQNYFYSDIYTYTIYNSKYTRDWIIKRWKYTPHKHIFPPVDMEIYNNGDVKEKFILSVARFEEGGTKKQKEMTAAFISMKREYPELTKSWKFILAGGSTGNNKYLSELKEIIKTDGNNSIELKINVTDNELKDLYKRSSLFWHLCGLGQNDPAKVEHFGMTIAEAMQNRMVPIVFDGGGQKEIVDHNISGFRVSSIKKLIDFTVKLLEDEGLREKLGENAYLKSFNFNKERFDKEVKDFFKKILPVI